MSSDGFFRLLISEWQLEPVLVMAITQCDVCVCVGRGSRTRSRACSNAAPKWNGMNCPETNISTESCHLHNCNCTQKFMQFLNFFMSWIVSTNYQWKAVRVCARHGNHATWDVKEDSEQVLAHALIQLRNRTERILILGQTSLQTAAVCPAVYIDASFELKDFSWNGCSACSLLNLSILEISWFLSFRMF